MSDELDKKIDRMAVQMNEIYKSVERLRKFFMWTLIITAALFILPLIGLALLIPWYLNMINSLVA